MAERRPYVPPRIEALTPTLVGKHLAADVRPAADAGAWFDAPALLREHGSPLFVVSESRLRDDYRAFRDQFSEAGLETRVAYSYKTNYLPAVCAVLHDEGAWAEVVSGMEYRLARSLGVEPREIIFNGPYKTRDELELALGEGALVNVDGFDELAAVEQVARDLDRAVPVGLRVNFRYGPAPWTKFGFSYDNGDARAALERVARAPRLRLEMLHNHSGTFQVDFRVYDRAAGVLVDLVRQARELSMSPRMLDLGGGFPSRNRLKPQFDLPGADPRERDVLFPYAEAIGNRLGRARGLFDEPPILVLEPGRAVVDAAMQLVCSVVATKEIPDQGPAVIVDAGVNLLPTAYWYDHRIGAAPPAGADAPGDGRRVNVYGPLCMQIDVLRERVLLPRLRIGDPLVISNVGAYCLSQSMQFIQPRPAVVLVGPEGTEVIRRPERWRDVFGLDRVPERLRREHGDF